MDIIKLCQFHTDKGHGFVINQPMLNGFYVDMYQNFNMKFSMFYLAQNNLLYWCQLYTYKIVKKNRTMLLLNSLKNHKSCLHIDMQNIQ